MQNETSPFSNDGVFTALRPALYAVAYHMLGNNTDAEDIVQEAFLRWRSTGSQARVPKAYLTTIVTRLCLKHLEATRSHQEKNANSAASDALDGAQAEAPETHAQLAEALSEALLVMLRALAPLERAVYLLREVFDCEYAEIAEMVDKTEENCRQILHRASQQVASRRPRYQVESQANMQIVKHFERAAADRNWAGLIEALSDDATLGCDGSDVGQGPLSVQGARAVAEILLQRASHWLTEGASIRMLHFPASPGMLVCRNEVPVGSIFLSTRDGAIRSVRMFTCPVRLRSLSIVGQS